MKTRKLFVMTAVIAAFMVLFAACDNGTTGGGPGGDPNDPGDGYSIGDTGPGGGIIFYVHADGFTMTDSGETCHYLEAAPDDMDTKLAWHSFGYNSHLVPGDFGTAIGTGKQNTVLILAEDADAPAAKACTEYSNNGLNDWFLPGKDELYELWRLYSAHERGDYAHLKQGEEYWSSTQFTGDYPITSARGAWDQNFNFTGTQDPIDKHFSYNVRPVRAF